MAEMTPVSEKNLDRYGSPPLDWSRARERLEQEYRQQGPIGDEQPHTHWLATVRPDGRPHVAAVGVVWLDGAFYFSAGADTRKAQNLAQNPHSVITLAAQGIDLVLEGEAAKVTDDATLQRAAEVFAAVGWAPTVRDGAFYHEYSAPSAGPPPWDLYRFTPKTVFGVATAEPYGATRWRF
ncbi:MAG: pyridoxamine 5'-phosphate oxidase family protein [Thermomicrobiales bacterium]